VLFIITVLTLIITALAFYVENIEIYSNKKLKIVLYISGALIMMFRIISQFIKQSFMYLLS
jgi:hypothetical protein